MRLIAGCMFIPDIYLPVIPELRVSLGGDDVPDYNYARARLHPSDIEKLFVVDNVRDLVDGGHHDLLAGHAYFIRNRNGGLGRVFF